jgi:hypothetical protein
MSTDEPGVFQTLEYRRDASVVSALPYGLLLCLFGLFVLALDDDRPPQITIAATVVILAGLALIAGSLARRFRPSPPVFVLSPQGIRYQISQARDVLIPWSEIRGVDSVDIPVSNRSIIRPGTITLRDVTVIMLSKEFYDTHIFVDSRFKRGARWNIIFKPRRAQVQMALLHEPFSLSAQSLRQAVETRWKAFGAEAAGAAAAQPTSADLPQVVAAGARPSLSLPWQLAKIIAPLIGIAIVGANLAGLWATQGQVKARAEQEVLAAWHKARQAEENKFEAQQRQRQKKSDDTIRKIDGAANGTQPPK